MLLLFFMVEKIVMVKLLLISMRKMEKKHHKDDNNNTPEEDPQRDAPITEVSKEVENSDCDCRSNRLSGRGGGAPETIQTKYEDG